jgi:DNA-directed RNA polymerase subunit RPC12/RpoP
MLEGRCRKCGTRYYGWALRNLEYQNCPDCGGRLEISESNGTVSQRHSSTVIDKNILKEILDILERDDNEREKRDN